VVVAGVTGAVPLAHDTVPTPLLIEQLVALATLLHVKVADWPAVIVVGLAVNEPMVGAAAFTVTVAVAGVLPPGPVAVKV
jgi:hypothetical protein